MTSASIVPIVVQQHVDDAAILHASRTALARAPHVKLQHLRRCDDRLDAHLDGLRVAGAGAKQMCLAALELATPGAAFVATVGALESRDEAWLQQLIALAQSSPECRSGLMSAFGWLQPEQLQNIVVGLLASESAIARAIGIAACGMHRKDPALGPMRRLEDADPLVRARACRAAGELGMREFLSRLGASVNDADPGCAFWSAWSAVLLGDRHSALQHLNTQAQTDGVFRARAFQLALLALPFSSAQELLGSLSKDTAQIRWLIGGVGLVGDSTYIPWLMKHMADDKLARLAGESFSLVTGADLDLLDLERKPPEDVVSGPNDDPNDANVAMDPDDDLPWPDVERIERWWAQNSSRFPPGQRYFVGAPLTREHCVEVLKNGYQRQRILAAHHLCLLEPGSVLFEWRAPAWRQARALAALG
jgi:uncharacterized protein (TIGR02270 family)